MEMIAQSLKQRNLGVIYASESESNTATDISDKRLLEPVGDRDSRHIGFRVQMPDAFEIASSEVTVGRLPDKVDVVIPVATVLGVHARIQRRGGNLLVTYLNSTNGTFINDQRCRGYSFGNISCPELENVDIAESNAATEAD
ncbi:uncharacterized protein LOC120210463 [Hibiscus syriacus]|uniref:uncharacterized protein LOC120210463 n=1 Tax=Hibiscus syriacus TaxID=106335 RepID=UPI0019208E05|nr:uncharacterized protein LOC120210463 [Hibiscus syriacus]